MKRSAEANLVYPFDTKQKFLMPPFFSDRGFLTEREGQSTVLSLNIDKPLEFSSTGKVGLKVGPGLHVTSKGALALDSELDSISAADPLAVKDGEVSLKMADGVTTTPEGKLTLHTKPPLAVGNGSLHMHHDETMTISEGKLGVRVAPPLVPTASGITVAVGQGLTLAGGAITAPRVTATGALKTRNNEILLSTDPVFTQTEGTLTLVTENPITAEEGALALKTGPEFETQGGALTLKLSPEIYKKPEGALALRLDAPLTVNAQNKLSLLTGNSLTVSGAHFDFAAIFSY